MKALVVFTDGGPRRHPLDRFLKPGFRHVFVCLVVGNWWLSIDGAEGVPVVKPLTGADFDLAAFYRDEGLAVVETEQRAATPRAPLAWNNCVGLAKAMLAIRCRALTPWQLYRHLTKDRP